MIKALLVVGAISFFGIGAATGEPRAFFAAGGFAVGASMPTSALTKTRN